MFGKLMGSHEQWLGFFAARCPNMDPPNVTGEETVYGPTGDSNREPLAYHVRTRTIELKSHTHRRPVTTSICLMRFIPNLLGTMLEPTRHIRAGLFRKAVQVCYIPNTTIYSGIHRGYLPPSVAGSFQICKICCFSYSKVV